MRNSTQQMGAFGSEAGG
ncbi:hypothetical protein V493_00714, partial [Pseudogymnoascus sp. VKM F-4281 (FW-2241)]